MFYGGDEGGFAGRAVTPLAELDRDPGGELTTTKGISVILENGVPWFLIPKDHGVSGMGSAGPEYGGSFTHIQQLR